jgi:hypothetical protein
MKKLSQTFEAVDSNGRQHKVCVYTERIQAGNCEEPAAEEGAGELRTDDGVRLTRTAKGQYVTIFGLRLRSNDPDAI